jgi:hypothetical protein
MNQNPFNGNYAEGLHGFLVDGFEARIFSIGSAVAAK